MCKEVWLKVYGTKLSAQILMSEVYSEMQNLVPVACSRKTAKQPAKVSSIRQLQTSENSSQNYTNSKGICSPQFILVNRFFNYFKVCLSIFVTTSNQNKSICVLNSIISH